MHIVKKILPIVIGIAAGFAYWYFIGCINGNCPITSSWYTSTLYGGIVGATWLIPARKKAAAVDKDKVQQPDREGHVDQDQHTIES